MSAHALLVCREDSVSRELATLLGELGISFQQCRDSEAARAALRLRRFDPVILDCDAAESTELLAAIRDDSTPSHDSIVLALASEAMGLKDLFRRGANLIVRKPISMEDAQRTLRAARGLVLRMRRHFSRQPVASLIYVEMEGLKSAPLMLDLSEGGMSVQADLRLQPKQLLRMNFSLPDSDAPLQATGEVVWTDPSGRSGIQFVRLPDPARQQLRQWLGLGAGTLRRLASGNSGGTSGDERARVTAPIRIDGAMETLLALVLDFAAVFGSVALFAFLVFLLAGKLPVSNYPAWVAGLTTLNGFLYRAYFFPSPHPTPGMTLGGRIIDAYLSLTYRRRLAQLSPALETNA
jgi:DNA-binding response OmpR family regulator